MIHPTPGTGSTAAPHLAALGAGGPIPLQPSETGFIVIRLARRYTDVDPQSLLELIDLHPGELGALRGFLTQNALTRSSRVILSVPPQQILDWEVRAQQVPDLAPIHSLLQYWRIDARGQGGASVPGSQELADLAAQLRGIDGVDMARVELTSVPPVVDDSDDPESKYQTYLSPPIDTMDPTAPGGVNARALWKQGFDGNGVGFVDVEYDWWLKHEDLIDHAFVTFPGDGSSDSLKYHGTRVLGVVLGVDNDRGIVGIAPNPRSIAVSSVLRASPGEFRPDAIANAITVAEPGDVILLELQAIHNGVKLPAEIEDDAFDAMRLAAALGFVVVEAAGNSGADLDGYVNDDGVAVVQRGTRESGAILVAASTAGPAYDWWPTSNYGSRIDCFAQGDGIRTTEYLGSLDESLYLDLLKDTSAASAVVAGAAVLLQSMWKAKTGSVLTPLQMRDVLSDPALNWPSGSVDRNIGVMPNLGAIADAQLPDVYLRDTVFDDGVVPTSGTLCCSPDIIVRQAAVPNPQAAFGEGSGTETLTDLSDPVTANSKHYLYARVRNRGADDALQTTVTFYWSEPATIVTPDQWNLVGTCKPFDVLANDQLVVSQPLEWLAPGPGHYCFIAVASHAADRAQLLPAKMSWDEFLALVTNNNNVAWRNFNVIGLAPQQAMPLRFFLAGDPMRAREFVVEILAHPAPAARVLLDVPLELARWIAVSPGAADFVVEGERVTFDLTRAGGLRARRLVLAEGERHECRIVLVPPWPDQPPCKPLVVRQSYEGLEVGRITWAFSSRRRDDR